MSSSAPPKFIDSKSKLNDTLVRYNIGAIDGVESPGSSLVLFIRQGKQGPSFFSLKAGENHIGRDPGCAVCIPRDEVSRRHALVTIDGLSIHIRDLGSSNGTYVNGKLVKESQLSDGDIINIGKTLRFVVSVRTQPDILAEDSDPRVPTIADDGQVKTPPPPVSAGGATIDSLEHERRQLAVLLQISLKFLESPRYKIMDVLFDVLPRVIGFDAACIVVKAEGKTTVSSHPEGISVSEQDVSRLVLSGVEQPKLREFDAKPLPVKGKEIKSVALVPLENHGTLCLLSTQKRAYTEELDFLSVLAKIYDAARASLASELKK